MNTLQEQNASLQQALQIVKDENEVNKKNMFRLMEENRKLKEENEEWKNVDENQDDPTSVKLMIEEIKDENFKLTKQNRAFLKRNEELCEANEELALRLDD